MPERILFIADDPVGVGGTERGLVQTALGLSPDRWRPLVVVPGRGPLYDMCTGVRLETRVLGFHRLPRGWRFRRHFPLDSWLTMRVNGWRLKRLLGRERVALIQTSAKQSLNVRNLASVANAAGVPLVWSCHDSNPRVLTHCSPGLGARLARVIAVSSHVKKELLNAGLGHAEKIEVVHNAIDLEERDGRASVANGSFREELGIPRTQHIVGLVGRLDRVKGQDLFLRAAELVAEGRRDVAFLLVGVIPPWSRWAPFADYFREVEALARRPGLRGCVHFVGWRSDMARVMASLDILVQPSRRETFGRVLIEAMASRKPVVVTRVGGMPEIVVDGETGLIVPAEDPAALAVAIRVLLEDADRRMVMGEAGRRRVEACFTLSQRLRRLEVIYREVLGCSGGVAEAGTQAPRQAHKPVPRGEYESFLGQGSGEPEGKDRRKPLAPPPTPRSKAETVGADR